MVASRLQKFQSYKPSSFGTHRTFGEGDWSILDSVILIRPFDSHHSLSQIMPASFSICETFCSPIRSSADHLCSCRLPSGDSRHGETEKI
ncbi:hypothetical protein YC2023_065720 [Brassica napus]